jgi:hypothetical protein
MFAAGESVEFSGKGVAHLAADPNVMTKTKKILTTADLVAHVIKLSTAKSLSCPHLVVVCIQILSNLDEY